MAGDYDNLLRASMETVAITFAYPCKACG